MLLLIFEYVPEDTSYHVIPIDHPQAENARKSSGLYIRDDDPDDDDPKEGDPIFEISEWLDTDEGRSMRVDFPYNGSVSEIIRCGCYI